MKVAFAIVISVALLVGCGHSSPKAFEDMTSQEQIAYCRAQTEQAVKECCTNEVSGIHAFVRLAVDDSSEAIVKWRALPEFDYVNHNGGIDRTNLHLIFLRGNHGTVAALEDSAYYEKQFEKQQQRILNGIHE